MNSINERFMHAYHEVDPRDRHNGLWIMSPDVYELLIRENPQPPYPVPMVPVDVDPKPTGEIIGPPPPQPARVLGIPIEIDNTAPPDTLRLDVDDVVTRAVRRGHSRGIPINIMRADRIKIEPIAPPEVTLRALVRKWRKRMKR